MNEPPVNVYITNENFFSKNGRKLTIILIVAMLLLSLGVFFFWFKPHLITPSKNNPTPQPIPASSKFIIIQGHQVLIPSAVTGTGGGK